MEHLNYKQFTSNPPMIHWDRYNYYTPEELKQMWNEAYAQAVEDIPAAARRIVQREATRKK